MQNNEIKLTRRELEILQDQEFLKLKQQAIDKIVSLFSKLREYVDEEWTKNNWKIPCVKDDVKISKGENYRDLPYVMLDYPRNFTRGDIFAFRTMFWWGHFFSFTLHLQGASFDQYREQLKTNLSQLPLQSDLFICVANTPWEYHYGKNNYKPLASMEQGTINSILEEKDFVKLSSRIPLTNDPTEILANGKNQFRNLMNLTFTHQ